MTSDANVAKVSIIGIGMRAHPGVAQTMFRTLSDKGINIQVISTSEIKVSVLIAEEYVELAVRALHSAYELDAHDDASRNLSHPRKSRDGDAPAAVSTSIPVRSRRSSPSARACARSWRSRRVRKRASTSWWR